MENIFEKKYYNKRDKKSRAPTCCGLHMGALNLGALSNQLFVSTQMSGQAMQGKKNLEGMQDHDKRRLAIPYIKNLVKRKIVCL